MSSRGRGVYPGYNNHAYTSTNGGGTLTSQPGSLIDLRLNRIQNGSTLGSRSKWDEEDTEDYEVDSVLDGFVSDSGLHSLTVSISLVEISNSLTKVSRFLTVTVLVLDSHHCIT